MLRLLADVTTRQVFCLGEAPFGPPFAAANDHMRRYNEAAASVASDAGAVWVDVWAPFERLASQVGPDEPLWVDGGHLTPLGDTVVLHAVQHTMFSMVDQLIEAGLSVT